MKTDKHPLPRDYKQIALVGRRSSGKTALFEVIGDLKKQAGGPTYEEKTEKVLFGSHYCRLVDLPGINSLNPYDPSEQLSSRFLNDNKIDLIIMVADSTMPARSMELAVEISETGIPFVIAMNMSDEANKHGVKIDIQKLEEEFSVPVVATTAVYGKGVKELTDKCTYMLNYPEKYNPSKFKFTGHIEEGIERLEKIIEECDSVLPFAPRYYALKAIENPDFVPAELMKKISSDRDIIADEFTDGHNTDVFEVISYERHHLAMKTAEAISVMTHRGERPLSDKLDDFLMHPILGHLILVLFFGLYFFSIFAIGGFLADYVAAPIESLADVFAPLKENYSFLWYSINGAYMGFAGVAGIVLPYFLPLVFLATLFEDSGYIARIAFMVDGIMHKIGLHGKSVIPFIMGFGCTVPAIYATRLIDNRRDRIVTAVLLPFIPCSARIAVIFALTAALAGPLWAIVIYAFVLLVIAITGKILSRILSEPTGLILEIPDLKKPSLKNSFSRTWFKIKDFVKDATIFLIGGSIVLGWIEYFDAAHYINTVISPLTEYLLELPKEVGSTLVFGFFRKELIIVMLNQALNVGSLVDLPMTVDQIIVFIIFVTLYFPCFTTFIVLWKEFGKKTVLLSSFLSIVIAIISAYLFRLFFNFF
ncbi:MAG: ferrous iron transport protein B [Candidatus Kapabacteria bacterium]|jgi:ferrous iron transport protein B|nr:ferrous iron transport protein B [Candidatus Kapabacteria bacterium]